jgi:hypothetical protein
MKVFTNEIYRQLEKVDLKWYTYYKKHKKQKRKLNIN